MSLVMLLDFLTFPLLLIKTRMLKKLSWTINTPPTVNRPHLMS